MIRKVLTIGDKALRGKCHAITKFDKIRLPLILRDMADTMYDKEGIGLAAPQIGIKRRIIVVDVEQKGAEPIEFINPEIIFEEGECDMVEACLSVPGRSGHVTRAEKIKVRAQDRTGEFFEVEAEGLYARCIQHEIDHLDGILYVDKMTEEVFADEEDEP
ncbi:MAG TPA: peptide deformylase [Clostridiales bacterium]|jgi:peptide deformylase|nr:peptide deformylase [Clostridiales bacterium]